MQERRSTVQWDSKKSEPLTNSAGCGWGRIIVLCFNFVSKLCIFLTLTPPPNQ